MGQNSFPNQFVNETQRQEAHQFIFTEEDRPPHDRYSMTLVVHDSPLGGRPRKGGIFDFGGMVEKDEIYLPGRSSPIISTKQARFHDVVIKGAFRDSKWGIPHYAREQMLVIENIRTRMHKLRMQWGFSYTWFGFLAETKFTMEDEFNILYELKFTNLGGIALKATRLEFPDRPPPSDVLEKILASIDSEIETTRALALSKVALSDLTVSRDRMSEAMEAAEVAATFFEDAKESL